MEVLQIRVLLFAELAPEEEKCGSWDVMKKSDVFIKLPTYKMQGIHKWHL
jgi:hypothetical protein